MCEQTIYKFSSFRNPQGSQLSGWVCRDVVILSKVPNERVIIIHLLGLGISLSQFHRSTIFTNLTISLTYFS